ncbi:hypothetical protein BGZ76_007858 [Entomortierella beljakovae]|nr:hypothetical protein BGZ76_007858 [Entomortierella beljakovae]
MTVTPQQKLLATCPCLNVKLHLATEPGKGVILVGKELKLGIAGVSVDHATVRCSNCDLDIYTFKPSTSSVNLEPTPLAYLASSIFYSPPDGVVVPTEVVITGEDIAARLDDPNYSHAFRLVLDISSASTADSRLSDPFSNSSTSAAAQQKQPEFPYRPHLERVRNILEKELESNLNAQQQKTEARIEAYKSQQMMALQKSIASTKHEKDRLWVRIQERVTAPPVSSGETGVIGNNSDGSLNIGYDGSSQHLLDVPGTLPVRFTSTSPQRPFFERKSSHSDVSMSLQFREFDQRLTSNSLRRQSLISANTILPEDVKDSIDPTQSNTAANATSSIIEDQPSTILDTETSSASVKPKKKVTISESVNRFSAAEPEGVNDGDFDDQDDDEDEDDEEDGVVFELDEELGFDNDGQEAREEVDDNDNDGDDNINLNDFTIQSTSNGISIKSSGQSLPKYSGMVVGSLRANYLRRQKGLRQHKQSLNDDELDFHDEGDGEYSSTAPAAAGAMLLGTSLPIQIHPRPANLPKPPPTTRISTLTSSLAQPPGSSPAAAMLQRRLSRAYGTDVPSDINSKVSRPSFSGSFVEVPPPATALTPVAASNAVIIDPLMLLEEDHDEEENEERLRRNRQPFSAINHRRDLERSSYQKPNLENSINTTPGVLASSSFVTQQSDFEPPHLYSARTYIGSTPWEMPTRITTKTGGQREGTQLDKQIAAEMAKELDRDNFG